MLSPQLVNCINIISWSEVYPLCVKVIHYFNFTRIQNGVEHLFFSLNQVICITAGPLCSGDIHSYTVNCLPDEAEIRVTPFNSSA